jgi:NTP pyrophosphatase (non-canonical NTP hydrolase)
MMDNIIKKEVLRKALSHFGNDAQFRKCAEECQELALAITHYLDGRASLDEVAEECADVLITVGQIRQALGADLVDSWAKNKMARLEERMAG